jgi:catechol 2,3-dioxygenase-like lactoylglutathione lyase family enzyme
MKPQLTHIALHVVDLDACIAFYQNFCQLKIIRRRNSLNKQVVWLAEFGREQDFVLVLMQGGRAQAQFDENFSHLGFALANKQQVDDLANKAKQQHILIWPPRQEDFPVGYYCGLVDPNGNFVEFSYGQPLGPGAKSLAPQANLS